MRNIEVLRDYFLGKDPQLKETLADNSLRLCGIKGKYYVLRDELVKKLKELKDYVDEQDGLLEDAIEGLIERIEAIENDFVTEEELASALLSYYTKSEVDALIATIPRFKVEVVVSLPTHDISTTTLYLVPSQDPETRNVYDEFIYVNNTWEQVGSTAVDMSNYYTKSEVDGKIFFNILTADVVIPDDSEINPLSGLTTGWYYTGTHKVYFENSGPNDPLVFPGGIFFLNMTSGNQYIWVGPVNTLGFGGQLGMWGYFDDIALEWVYGGYDILASDVGISSTSTDQQIATAKAIYDYIQGLNISTITDITTSTFNFAHVDTDEGFYSLPANCTIDFGEMNGSPVTYTTVSPVLVQVVKESGGHVKHAMFTDIQSDGVYYIYGTTTYPALTGTVVQKKLTNTIEYIRVNGNFVPVSNIGVAEITVPTYSEFTGATSSVAGTSGLVPAPTTSDPDKVLKGDGTWGFPVGGSYNDLTNRPSINGVTLQGDKTGEDLSLGDVPVGTIVQFDGNTTPVGYEDVALPSSPYNFSTTETVIGNWIDGKPLYQIVVDLGQLPSSSGTYCRGTTIADLDKMIYIGGFMYNFTSNDMFAPLPFPTGGSSMFSSRYIGMRFDNTSGRGVQLYCSGDFSALKAYAILRYTKTTD